MDLSAYVDCELGAVAFLNDWRGSWARVGLHRGPNLVGTLVFEGVGIFVMEGSEGVFVDQISVPELPREGRWPEAARHLIHHHNNVSEQVWVVISAMGPRIEVVAESLRVEQQHHRTSLA